MTGAPYGATVPGVRALTLDVAAEGLRTGQRAPRVGDPQVEEWIDEAGSVVALRLARLELLPADRTAPGWALGIPTQAELELQARQLVQLYAASLLADVTHPERAQNGKGFGAVLMARFDAAVSGLASEIDTAVERSQLDGGSAVSAPAPWGIGTDRTTGWSLPAGFTQYGYPAGRGF